MGGLPFRVRLRPLLSELRSVEAHQSRYSAPHLDGARTACVSDDRQAKVQTVQQEDECQVALADRKEASVPVRLIPAPSWEEGARIAGVADLLAIVGVAGLDEEEGTVAQRVGEDAGKAQGLTAVPLAKATGHDALVAADAEVGLSTCAWAPGEEGWVAWEEAVVVTCDRVDRMGWPAEAAFAGFAAQLSDRRSNYSQPRVVVVQAQAAGSVRVHPIVDLADHQAHWAGMPEGAHLAAVACQPGWAGHSSAAPSTTPNVP